MFAFPFDSHVSGYDDNGYPIYDRASTSAEIAMVYDAFLSDGVFLNTMCQVLAGSGMTATVGVGGAHIKGRFCYLDTPVTVTFQPATSQARIDTVVLRRDLSSSVNNIVCAVVKGTSGNAAPALTRDGTIWEIGLANVRIPANSNAIQQANITDTRLDTQRCGLVTAIQTDIDTNGLYAQIQADLASFKDNEQASFEQWFSTLKTNLEGDVAAALTGRVTALEQGMPNKLEGRARTVTLSSSGWSSSAPYTQTVTVSGVTADNTVQVAPAPASHEAYCGAIVRATAQASNALTFTASKVPTANLAVNVLIIDGVTA